MDMNIQPLGQPPTGDKTTTNADKRVQSQNGFSGVDVRSAPQTKQAVEQSVQTSDVRQRAHGQLEIDEATRRVYYKRRDPETGDVQKFPSEAQLRMAAAMKEELEKKLDSAMAEAVIPGELLDAKA